MKAWLFPLLLPALGLAGMAVLHHVWQRVDIRRASRLRRNKFPDCGCEGGCDRGAGDGTPLDVREIRQLNGIARVTRKHPAANVDYDSRWLA